MRDLFVRRVYTKQGVSIVVDMDFVKKTISLVEKDGKTKKWCFTQRTPEYMNGWLAILRAMEFAVAEAKKEMDALEDKEFKDFLEMYYGLDKALKKGQGILDDEQN